MGIDARIYIEGATDGAAIEAGERWMRDRLGTPDYDGQWLTQNDYNGPRVELNTLHRFYGPGYERGPWPILYSYIRAMRACFPSNDVHYGGDSSEDGPVADDAYCEKIWLHWSGPHGNDYRAHARAWNAAHQRPQS